MFSNGAAEDEGICRPSKRHAFLLNVGACVGGWGGEYNIMSKCNFKLYTVGMHTQKT